MKLIRLLNVIWLLGIYNSLYAAYYKFTVRYKLRKYLSPLPDPIIYIDNFFSADQKIITSIDFKKEIIESADKILKGEFLFFNYNYVDMGMVPDWFKNPFGGKFNSICTKHWSEIEDFDDTLGDIKGVWEISRFDWLVTLAQAYSITNDKQYLDRINILVRDWIEKNPAGLGINWKCGQEASIRCFNVINAWLILGKPLLSKSLNSFLTSHAQRIESNLRYALCQDNNHATSEASGLYVLGLVLDNQKLKNKGRYYLEKTVLKLILDDGSFSQNSINYHRLMLDTLSFAEKLRIEFNDQRFSDRFYTKVELATNWLSQFVSVTTGDVPNLGANDGAQLYHRLPQSFRDFASSVKESAHVFKIDEDKLIKKDQFFNYGGYGILRNGKADLYLRAPVYKFRPSQADQMHVDLWKDGKPCLVDAGSYSYNDKSGVGKSLKSSMSHNAIVFDDQDSMPVIGRFLYGDWLRGMFLKTESGFICSYLDYRKYHHERVIEKAADCFLIKDTIDGTYKKANLYWHLSGEDWHLDKGILKNALVEIEVLGVQSQNIKLIKVKKSLYYQDYQEGLCLSVELGNQVRQVITSIKT